MQSTNTNPNPDATLPQTSSSPTSPTAAPNTLLTPPDSGVLPTDAPPTSGQRKLADWIAKAQHAEDQHQQEQQRRQAAERLRQQQQLEHARARFAVD